MLKLTGSAGQILFHLNEGNWHQSRAKNWAKHFMFNTFFGPHDDALREVVILSLCMRTETEGQGITKLPSQYVAQFEFRHRQATRTCSLNHCPVLPYPNCFLLFLQAKLTGLNETGVVSCIIRYDHAN